MLRANCKRLILMRLRQTGGLKSALYISIFWHGLGGMGNNRLHISWSHGYITYIDVCPGETNFLVLVAYLIILGAIQAGPRESPSAIQVHYNLLGQYLYKWDFLVQARSANFFRTFWPFLGLISGQNPKQASSSIKFCQVISRVNPQGCQKSQINSCIEITVLIIIKSFIVLLPRFHSHLSSQLLVHLEPLHCPFPLSFLCLCQHWRWHSNLLKDVWVCGDHCVNVVMAVGTVGLLDSA